MSQFQVLVEIQLKPGIVDAQGATIERAAHNLGYSDVRGVSVGKAIRFWIESRSKRSAESTVDELCKQFLANPVMEDARVEVTRATPE